MHNYAQLNNTCASSLYTSRGVVRKSYLRNTENIIMNKSAGPNRTTLSPSFVCLLLEDGQRRRMSLDPAYPWLQSGMTPET